MKETLIWQHEATFEVHKLWPTSVAALWSEGCCSFDWSAGWIHKVLLLSVNGIVVREIPTTSRETGYSCRHWSRGRKQARFVTTLTHKAGSDEELCQGQGQNTSSFQVPHWKIHQAQCLMIPWPIGIYFYHSCFIGCLLFKWSISFSVMQNKSWLIPCH